MKSILKKTVFIIFAGLMVLYFFMRAWTPLWIDLSVVAIAIIVGLFGFLERSENEADPDRRDSENLPRE